MRSRFVVPLILLVALFLVGCGDTPLFSQPQSYLLPEFMIVTPATGPDGYNWSTKEDQLVLEKEEEIVYLEEGDKLYLDRTEFELLEVDGELVTLRPVITEEDPMNAVRRKLD